MGIEGKRNIQERPSRELIVDKIYELLELKMISPTSYEKNKYEFHEMAHGANPEGIRQALYKGWKNNDFLEVCQYLD